MGSLVDIASIIADFQDVCRVPGLYYIMQMGFMNTLFMVFEMFWYTHFISVTLQQ
jgi:hypothetical protein